MVKKVTKKKAPVKKKVAAKKTATKIKMAKKAPAKKTKAVAKKAPAKKAPAKKAGKKAGKKHVEMPTRLISPSFVIAFPSLFKPKQNDRGGDEYSCTMYFDKDSTDMTGIQGAIDQIVHDEYKGKIAGLKMPIRDGDDPSDNYSTYEGTNNCLVLAAKSVFKPGVVDVDLEDVIDPGMIYPGAVCRASLTAYAYDVNGNKGISFALNNVQFLTDGEPLTGAGTKASDEFGDAEDAEFEEYEELEDDKEEVEEEEVEEDEDEDEDEEEEEEEEEEEGIEVYENEDGDMVYLDEDGDEVLYDEADFE